MIKNDRLTGEKFEALRINQKFAKPENRIKYNNQKATKLRHDTSFINKQLHVSLKILNDLPYIKNETIVHKQYLLGKGFSFLVHTHYENYEGISYCAIYDYIIIPLENERIKIIKND